MGCFYATNKAKRSFYTSLSTNSPSFSFSQTNEDSFLVPRNYFYDVGQLRDIIVVEQAFWGNFKGALLEMNKRFVVNSQSIIWYLQSNEDYQSKGNSLSTIPLFISNFGSTAIPNSFQCSFFEVFPFMKNFVLLKDRSEFKTKLIFEIDSVLCTKNFLARNPWLSNPSVEVEINSYEDNLEGSQEVSQAKSNGDPEVLKIKTRIFPKSQGKSFEWKEVISCEIPHKSALERGVFKISLFFFNKLNRKRELVGEHYAFSFEQLGNQTVFQKIVNIKYSQQSEVSCFLLFKCQLIFDVEGLLLYWRNDIDVKTEVIRRILARIDRNQSGRGSGSGYPTLKKTKSLVFQDNKIKEELKAMMESFHTAFNTLNMSLRNDRNERISFKEAYKKTFGHKLIDSMISQESGVLSQSGYYENQYFLA